MGNLEGILRGITGGIPGDISVEILGRILQDTHAEITEGHPMRNREGIAGGILEEILKEECQKRLL